MVNKQTKPKKRQKASTYWVVTPGKVTERTNTPMLTLSRKARRHPNPAAHSTFAGAVDATVPPRGMKKLLLLFGLMSQVPLAFAQEGPEPGETNEEGRHRVSLALGHAHVPAGVTDGGQKKWLLLGSWGLDYDYWFGPRWAAGLHNDVIVEDFEVADSDLFESAGVIRRSYPVASCATLLFKPGRRATYLVGTGGEFASSGSYFLVRAGVEYGWQLPGAWEVGVDLLYDIKWNAYDTWTLGFGVSKLFGKPAPKSDR